MVRLEGEPAMKPAVNLLTTRLAMILLATATVYGQATETMGRSPVAPRDEQVRRIMEEVFGLIRPSQEPTSSSGCQHEY